MRPIVLALAAGLALASPVMAQPPPPPAIVAALAAPDRPAKDREKDADRHPAELLAFAEVKPGQTVVDFWPGSGYWSRILGRAVGPSGRVMAYVPAEITGFKTDPLGIAKAMAAEPGRANVTVISDRLPDPPPPAAMNSVDLVFIYENYHDLHDSFVGKPDMLVVNRGILQGLKPGGLYVIVDHAAKAGSGLANTEDLHRIDPAAVKAELTSAGFVFDGETKLLADPADPHEKNVFDPAIRGHTDRFAYRFRKPRA